jgi:hypothetical protein
VVTVQPKRLAQQTFPAVADNRIADFPGNRQAKTRMGKPVAMAKHHHESVGDAATAAKDPLEVVSASHVFGPAKSERMRRHGFSGHQLKPLRGV